MKMRKLISFLIIALFLGIMAPNGFIRRQNLIAPTLTNTQNKVSTSTSSEIAATTTEKTSTVKKPTAKPTPVVKQPLTPVEPPPPPAPVKPAVDYEAINQFARKAVVNILCTSHTTQLSSISGTGVMVDPRGIILTNAHVGQYWLLDKLNGRNSIDCVIRTGSPATPQYHAELMYISPSWVEENKDLLREKDPTGTGENDFAFLHITDKTDKSPLPATFDFVSPNPTENLMQGQNVVLVSYPAGFLGGTTVLQNLYMTSAITTIQNIFTFRDGTSDVVSVGGTVVSQKGASGGAVVDSASTLIGLITTSSDATTTSSRELNAITLSHINRSLKKDTTGGLADFLAQDPASLAETFNSTVAGTLTKIITDELNK